MSFNYSDPYKLEALNEESQTGGLIIKKKASKDTHIFKKPSLLGLDKLAEQVRNFKFQYNYNRSCKISIQSLITFKFIFNRNKENKKIESLKKHLARKDIIVNIV